MVEIKQIPIEFLHCNEGQLEGVPANPRTIRGERFEALKKSLTEFKEMTELRPLIGVPYGDKGEIAVIAGNMRLRAAQSLNWESLPCILLSEKTPAERLREIAIKDNMPYGDNDWDALANEWDTAELEGWGMELPTDWGETPTAEDDGFTDDDAEKAEAVCKTGEVWRLGDHRLMCGDSSDPDAVARLMDGHKADMVFTDPPYGVSIGDKNRTLKNLRGGEGNSITENIRNDDVGRNELYEILVRAMANCRVNSRDDASYFVTSPQGGDLCLMMMMMMRDAGLPVRHILIWKKSSATFSLGRLDYDYAHEPIFYTWGGSHHNYRKGENRTTVWEYNKPQKCDLHPTMKPVALVANCLKDCSREGDIVLDLFGGSGTTMIAAEQLHRRCFMMELDPHYCDVIIARWEKLTGNKAEKLQP